MSVAAGHPVIINADDLGLSDSVTAGILEALEKGWVSDSSLMAPGDAFPQAAAGLKAMGRRHVGVHLTLVDRELPMAPPEQIPLLLGPDARFPLRRNVLIARAAAFPRKILAQVEREWRLQLRRLLEAGLTVSHLDSHQHLHLLPGLAELALTLAREAGIPFVRVPRFRALTAGRPVSLAVNLLAARLERLARRAGIGTVDGAGVEDSGRQSLEALTRLLDARSRGVLEIGLHPGRVDAATATKYAHWGFSWEEELACLAGPAMARQLAQRGRATVSFATLAAHAG